MATLFVPPRVARELVEERLQFGALVNEACYSDAVCEKWNRELRRLDPLLRMVRAPDKEVPGTPLVPGHYHLIRDNPGAPMSVTPVRGPHGEFVYPPGRLLEQLKEGDLWDAKVARLRQNALQEAERQVQREREQRRADRQANILDHYKSVTNASVSMNRETPWTQNNQPSARRDRRARRAKGA